VETEMGLSSDTKLADPWILDLPSSKTVRNKELCFINYLVLGALLSQDRQTKISYEGKNNFHSFP
jgi:hypothetical protein